MKRILVLEDVEIRINWLHETLKGTGVVVSWCRDVESFLAAACEPHDLVIFDHDLELQPAPGYCEPRPLTGLDAAHKYNPERVVPAIIWSGNEYGSKQISLTLDDKGIPNSVIPFLSRNFLTLRKIILDNVAH